jgi:hypothetical protein
MVIRGGADTQKSTFQLNVEQSKWQGNPSISLM